MTFEEAKVIGLGSLGLLLLFGSIQAIRFNAWTAIRRYVAANIVNDYQVDGAVMSREIEQTTQTDKTDRQTDLVSEADQWLDRLEVDRSKTALIEILVYSGWDVGQIRGVVKGDNGAIGLEIEAARKRLGIAPEPPRQLRVRDNGSDVRLIPMEVE